MPNLTFDVGKNAVKVFVCDIDNGNSSRVGKGETSETFAHLSEQE